MLREDGQASETRGNRRRERRRGLDTGRLLLGRGRRRNLTFRLRYQNFSMSASAFLPEETRDRWSRAGNDNKDNGETFAGPRRVSCLGMLEYSFHGHAWEATLSLSLLRVTRVIHQRDDLNRGFSSCGENGTGRKDGGMAGCRFWQGSGSEG